MKAFIALCAILALVEGASLNNRIVGGQAAKPGQFKYIASLRRDRGNAHFCGATIIGRRVLLTAAHCRVYDASQTVAVLGTTKLNDAKAKRYKLQDFIIHENYNGASISNDVAVIILKEDIEFSDLVQPLPLTNRSISNFERLTSAGWGLTRYPGSVPNDLQWMQMNVLPHTTCSKSTGDTDLTGKICTLEAEGEGVCSGDSGGPLVNELNEVAGVTSAAYLCALGMPDLFTDVFYYKDWIVEHAGENL